METQYVIALPAGGSYAPNKYVLVNPSNPL
jgi:hypothetical protein